MNVSRIRRRMPRHALLASICLTAALTASAGVAVGAQGSNKARVVGSSAITWAVSADVTGLDPLTNGQQVSQNILFRAYQSLLQVNANGSLGPSLATSWKETSPTTYVFQIRHGVRFSNGRLMTSADVAGSIEEALKPGSAGSSALGMIKSAKATGPYTVAFKLKNASGIFLDGLASVYSSILPMKELDAGTFNPNKQVLGTGPYMVASHSEDESWTLKANPYYWQKGLPKVKNLDIDIIPDPASELAALRSGRVDVAEFQDPDTIKLLSGVSHVKVVQQSTTDFNVLELNAIGSTSKVLNKKVRTALALAINRHQLVELAEAGSGVSMVAPGAPPGEQGACAAKSVPSNNVAEAKSMLSAAGAEGMGFTISYNNGDPVDAAIALVLQSQWEAVGLKPVLDGSGATPWFTQVYTKGDFDADISWYGDATAWQNFGFWSPKQNTWTSKFSVDDPTIDSLLAKSAPLAPGNAQSAVFNQLCKRMASDANIVPLTTRGVAVAYRDDLINPQIQTFEPEDNTVKLVANWTLR
jgi:peptide/nickel transport system substrate-binding protein